MTRKLLAAALAALIPMSGIALANDQGNVQGNDDRPATPAGQSGSFETLDTNKDGRISMPEASADPSLVETFSTADRNGDGYLDNAEFDDRTQQQQ